MNTASTTSHWIANHRYRIKSPVAPGGSSNVFTAIDHDDPEEPLIILKLLKTSSQFSPDILDVLFQREVNALRMLSHPSIVELLDYGYDQEHECFYIVLERVEGAVTLRDRVPNWKPDVLDCSEFMLQLLDAISYAHECKIVHRDLNPKNILIDRSGNPKIIDFGVSKILGVINAGKTVGEFFTRPYASPEQITGQEASYSSDVFQLAAVMYYILTRSDPDPAIPLIDQFDQLEGLPNELRNVTRKMSCASVLERYPSASACQRGLQEAIGAVKGSSQRLCLAVKDAAVKDLYKYAVINSESYERANRAISESLSSGSCLVRDTRLDGTPTWELIGENLVLRCVQESGTQSRRSGRLVVTGVQVPPPHVLEKLRSQGFSVRSQWRICHIQDPHPGDATDIEELIAEADYYFHHFDIRQKRLERRKELVRTWREVLLVDRDLKNAQLLQLRYKSFEFIDGDTVIAVDLVQGTTIDPAMLSDAMLAMPNSRRPDQQVTVGHYLSHDEARLYISKLPGISTRKIASQGQVTLDERQWAASWNRQKDALDRIVSKRCVNTRLPDILLDPGQTKQFSSRSMSSYFNNDMDESKTAAIESALSTRDLYLIQGPPGTGKTLVISELVAQIVTQQPNAKILLVSQSNVPVDNALAKVTELLPECRVARLGREESMSQSAQLLSLEKRIMEWAEGIKHKSQAALKTRQQEAESASSVVDHIAMLKELQGLVRGSDLADTLEDVLAGLQVVCERFPVDGLEPTQECISRVHGAILESVDPMLTKITLTLSDWQKRVGTAEGLTEPFLEACSLVAGTCVGIAGVRGLPERFDWAIVDEAGHATPSELLIPLVRAERSILVGDHKQLPPVIDYDLKSELRKRDAIDPIWLDKSLFEFLFENLPDKSKTVLRKQFRMHPEIANLVSTVFYPYEQLTSGVSADDRLHGWAKWNTAVVWYSTSDYDDRFEQWDNGTRSYYNMREMRILEQQLTDLDQSLPSSAEKVTVGVITGYVAQASMLRRRLELNDNSKWRNIDIEINTVDAFQGRDRDIVFYSIVRSNRDGRIGFLEDCRRLNVALSRARKLLFVVGDHEMVGEANTRNGNPFRQVLSYIREHREGCILVEGQLGRS